LEGSIWQNYRASPENLRELLWGWRVRARILYDNSGVSTLFRELAEEIEAEVGLKPSQVVGLWGRKSHSTHQAEIEYDPRKRKLEIQVKLKEIL
jgi:hypothetical protein